MIMINNCILPRVVSVAAALVSSSLTVPSYAAPPLVFNITPPTNDLQGTFAARVQFAQSQIIPAFSREGDNQPHLIAQRKSLLLVRPLIADDTTPVSVLVRDSKGRQLGSLKLNAPHLLPKTAYYEEGAPESIDFKPAAGTTRIIRDASELTKLTNEKGEFLLGELKLHALVQIETANGRWVNDIYLPSDPALNGKIIRVIPRAAYASTIHHSGRRVQLSEGQATAFKYVNGRWLREGQFDNNPIIYASNTWSGVLPAAWVMPGVTLELSQGRLSGKLSGLKVGAPSQVILSTIDLGMLTTPRGAFEFARDPKAHREYFQTLPTSRLIVNQYAPLSLSEVMLPTGTLLTDFDPSVGGVYDGTMRGRIGKELISQGINNANYGLRSTAGVGEGSPYLATQITAHTSRGKYSNGIQVHGLSGGNGMVTLSSTLGNEFSHELGHNYGLGHYVGGFKGSVHRSADNINSTWGWDADENRFIPNFSSFRSGRAMCLENECQKPFDGRTFGADAMAGGAPMSDSIRFTLYSPNSAAIIQDFLESKIVFDAKSPTGFSKWNDNTLQMEPYVHKIDITSTATAPFESGKALGAATLASLLADYDALKVVTRDGSWTPEIHLPPASTANRDRGVTIDHSAAYNSTLFINDQKVTVANGFKKSYVSDGTKWNDTALPVRSLERKPQDFGVPVVTLVGYYDPSGEKQSYIFPALHGAYGFTYADDAKTLNEMDCELRVTTRDGVLRFRLANNRIDLGHMNKFHVNVPAASQPTSVSVVRRRKVLHQRQIMPVTEKLSVTINGAP